MATELPPPYSACDRSSTHSDETKSSSNYDSHPEKLLPSIPISNNLQANPSVTSRKRPHSHASSVEVPRRSRTLSSFLPRSNPLQRTLIKCPQAFAGILENLPWANFYALTCTCQDFRNILRNIDMKDVVLAQYVPGYRWCIENCDKRFQDVPTSITELDLLRGSIS